MTFTTNRVRKNSDLHHVDMTLYNVFMVFYATRLDKTRFNPRSHVYSHIILYITWTNMSFLLKSWADQGD